jgi:hypothetical protein
MSSQLVLRICSIEAGPCSKLAGIPNLTDDGREPQMLFDLGRCSISQVSL